MTGRPLATHRTRWRRRSAAAVVFSLMLLQQLLQASSTQLRKIMGCVGFRVVAQWRIFGTGAKYRHIMLCSCCCPPSDRARREELIQWRRASRGGKHTPFTMLGGQTNSTKLKFQRMMTIKSKSGVNPCTSRF